MNGLFDRLEHRKELMIILVSLFLFHQNFSLCCSLNDEGLALLKFRERVFGDPFGALSNWNNDGRESNPCSWFGVECLDGKVVALNLKDLCLEGTLAPELRELVYLKSINLRNNSFYGGILKEMGDLRELEVLDLGYNNFSGSLPSDFTNDPSRTKILLDNNRFLAPEVYERIRRPDFRGDDDHLTDIVSTRSCNSRSIIWNTAEPGDVPNRRLLQFGNFFKFRGAKTKGANGKEKDSFSPSPSPFSGSPLSSSPLSNSPSASPFESPVSSPSASPSGISLPPSPSPFLKPTPKSPDPVNSPVSVPAQEESHTVLSPSPARTPKASKREHHMVVIMAGVFGSAFFILISAIGCAFFRSNKVVTVKPWATGLSGQLQKAFVTGVPKLNRSEIVVACEDFSNIIGFFSEGTVYKGTLSSGVEIAVTSNAVTSRKDWSKTMEEQFRKKIETLSKVNHKNFVNLIGFCEEEEPFTRIMVFEYAPNGTLFEHLHIKEAEHLDWGMRLRIAMGVAYCLEHMHQLNPPIPHEDLQSSSVYLTEDYAAKISDFRFWNEVTAAKMQQSIEEPVEILPADPESNVYSFGVILFEMITGRIPFSADADFLKIELDTLREMVDPTLKLFQEEELVKLFQVMKDCVHPDPKQRPTMVEISLRLKEITAMGPDGATPKLSPLWWAELEIMSEVS
ncbi:hypothetical protein UlMin_013122 [Ulmus minor]